MPVSVDVRIARVEDAPAACAVLRRSIMECCTEDHRNDDAILAAWLGNKTPEIVAGWFACESNHGLVAIRKGEIVGVALMTRPGKIALCYVTPEARYTGTGRALLQGLEAQATCWRVAVLRVASTATAKAFYLRNGYVVTCDTTSAFGAPAISLAKRLPNRMARSGPIRTSCCQCSQEPAEQSDMSDTQVEG